MAFYNFKHSFCQLKSGANLAIHWSQNIYMNIKGSAITDILSLKEPKFWPGSIFILIMSSYSQLVSVSFNSNFLIHKGKKNWFPLNTNHVKQKLLQNWHLAEIKKRMTSLKIAYLDAINYFKQLFGIWTTILEKFRNCNIMKDLKYLDLKP